MRTYPERPILGVGGVVIADGRVLLVKRAHEPLRGAWTIPGGAVEVGETVAAAVARELLEETGLVVEPGPVVEVVDRIEADPDGRIRYHFVIVDVLCIAARGEAICGSDATDICWAPVDELSSYEVSDTAQAVIHKALVLLGSTPYPSAPLEGR